MKQTFMCSLCHKGILGGALYLDAETIIYKTQKITVDAKYRKIIMPLSEVKEIVWKTIIFPIATFYMESGESYKLMIFNKTRFMKYYKEYGGK